jgi:hypothetical protein
MPTLRRYVDGRGYYVKTVVKRQPVTFQLTKEGGNYLVSVLQLADQDIFSVAELDFLIKRGWAYTKRSGPGDPIPTTKPKTRRRERSRQTEAETGCGGCATIIAIFLFLITAAVVYAVTKVP